MRRCFNLFFSLSFEYSEQPLKSQTCCDREDKDKDIEKFDRISDPIKKRHVLKNKGIEGIVMAQR